MPTHGLRGLRVAMLVALASACSYDAPPATTTSAPSQVAWVELPTIDASVEGATEIRYYEVTGASVRELVDELGRGTSECSSDAVGAGPSCLISDYGTWDVDKVGFPDTGLCRIRVGGIDMTHTVVLPRWTGLGLVHPDLVTWWQKVLEQRRRFASEQIAIKVALLPDLRDDLQGAPCDHYDAIFDAWERKVTDALDAHDAEVVATWRWPEYTGPAIAGW